MTHTLKLVDRANPATIYFNFDDPDGSDNPAPWKIRSFVSNFDIGEVEAPVDIVKAHGSAIARRVIMDPQVRTLHFSLLVASPDKKTRTLVAGIGDMYRRLQSDYAEEYLIAWDDGDGVRFFEPLGVEGAMPNMRQDNYQPMVTQSGDDPNLEFDVICQPYLMGDADAVATSTITSDPTIGTGRAVAVNVTGEAPTPVTIELSPDNSDKMTGFRIAAKWYLSGTDRADYLNETKYTASASSTRGWVTTLGQGTTSGAASDAAALNRYGSNYAIITVPQTLTDTFYKRARYTRTTKLDSLRGEWAVYARVFAVGTEKWDMQLRWGPGATDPVPYTEDKVLHSIDIGEQSAWEDVYMGRIAFPEVEPFNAVTLEFWASARSVGTNPALLWFNGFYLLPASPQSRIYMREGGTTVYDGYELVTPAARVGADPAWVGGDRGDAGQIRLSNGENVGIRPNSGTAYGTGRQKFTFDISRRDTSQDDNDMKVRIVDVGASSVIKSKVVDKAGKFNITLDTTSGTLYQAQVFNQASGPRPIITVESITREYIPTIGTTAWVHCDPEAADVTRRDASNMVLGGMKVEGAVPFVLEPGWYVISIIPENLETPGHDNRPTSPNSNQTYTLRVTHRPRYLQ